MKEQTWLDDGPFQCVIVVAANCGDEEWVGNYLIDDEGHLILEYAAIRPWGEAGCICPTELEYRIGDLERRDYTIKIRRAGVLHP